MASSPVPPTLNISTTSASGSAAPEFSESRSIELHWRLTDLRTHFESSKAETKSRCVKSAAFDGGRWQIFWYASSGVDGHLGLYLAALPTLEERERGGEAWVREGSFRFSFELKSVDGAVSYKTMEAQDHRFSAGSFNWGWNSFWRRNDAYFNNPKVRGQDAFEIVCTVTSAPLAPESHPRADQKLIPLALVEAYASLFDDEAYSDVVFRIRHGDGYRRVYASRKILGLRSEYFATLFDGSWVEGHSDDGSVAGETSAGAMSIVAAANDVVDEDDVEPGELSDEDGLDLYDAQDDGDVDEDFAEPSSSAAAAAAAAPPVSSASEPAEAAWSGMTTTPPSQRSRTTSHAKAPTSASRSDVDPPRAASRRDSGEHAADAFRTPASSAKRRSRGGPTPRRRARVTVTDASYEAYRALLCWLYTDQISFRPLNSQYYAARATPAGAAEPRFRSLADFHRAAVETQTLTTVVGKRPARPCSAKAIYTLADKLNLPELRSRAADHIQRSLTEQNCAFEVFSAFSARFPEVQQAQMAFLLDRWPQVRASPAMLQVLEMVQRGHWPAFSSVWISLLPSLDVRPSSSPIAALSRSIRLADV